MLDTNGGFISASSSSNASHSMQLPNSGFHVPVRPSYGQQNSPFGMLAQHPHSPFVPTNAYYSGLREAQLPPAHSPLQQQQQSGMLSSLSPTAMNQAIAAAAVEKHARKDTNGLIELKSCSGGDEKCKKQPKNIKGEQIDPEDLQKDEMKAGFELSGQDVFANGNENNKMSWRGPKIAKIGQWSPVYNSQREAAASAQLNPHLSLRGKCMEENKTDEVDSFQAKENHFNKLNLPFFLQPPTQV